MKLQSVRLAADGWTRSLDAGGFRSTSRATSPPHARSDCPRPQRLCTFGTTRRGCAASVLRAIRCQRAIRMRANASAGTRRCVCMSPSLEQSRAVLWVTAVTRSAYELGDEQEVSATDRTTFFQVLIDAYCRLFRACCKRVRQLHRDVHAAQLFRDSPMPSAATLWRRDSGVVDSLYSGPGARVCDQFRKPFHIILFRNLVRQMPTFARLQPNRLLQYERDRDISFGRVARSPSSSRSGLVHWRARLGWTCPRGSSDRSVCFPPRSRRSMRHDRVR